MDTYTSSNSWPSLLNQKRNYTTWFNRSSLHTRRGMPTKILLKDEGPKTKLIDNALSENLLPVDETVKGKGMPLSSKCSYCSNHQEESLLHPFFSSNIATQVWADLSLLLQFKNSEISDVADCVSSFLTHPELTTTAGRLKRCTFMAVMWEICSGVAGTERDFKSNVEVDYCSRILKSTTEVDFLEDFDSFTSGNSLSNNMDLSRGVVLFTIMAMAWDSGIGRSVLEAMDLQWLAKVTKSSSDLIFSSTKSGSVGTWMAIFSKWGSSVGGGLEAVEAERKNYLTDEAGFFRRRIVTPIEILEVDKFYWLRWEGLSPILRKYHDFITALPRRWRLVDVEELAQLEVMSHQEERADVWWSYVLCTQFADGAMEVALAQFIRSMSVLEYKARFAELSKYAPDIVADERRKVKKFIMGLKPSLRTRLVALGHRSMEEALSVACMQEAKMEVYLEEKRASLKRPASAFQWQDRKKKTPAFQ
ncbi:hypothetical protein Taro_048721 [Colocasia esculenta]|uniref:Reverse transcriptase zinc-binding domain-containing protein n=1 Tax=Colocasia esculenta TaxID=4460 RepID=A0A843X8X1_COLES|nr:hypothetical protein [Colocasia esculenta]